MFPAIFDLECKRRKVLNQPSQSRYSPQRLNSPHEQHWHQFTTGLTSSLGSGCSCALIAASHSTSYCWAPNPGKKPWGFLQQECCSGWKVAPGPSSPASAQLSPRRSDTQRWEHECFVPSGCAGGSTGSCPFPAWLSGYGAESPGATAEPQEPWGKEGGREGKKAASEKLWKV